MLEKIKYTGIANFDILSYGGKSYCLELNPRQGRSFDYLRCAGVSLAKLLLADMKCERIDSDFKYRDGVWRCVSKRTLQRHSKDRDLLKRAIALEREGAGYYAYDSRRDKGVRRRAYVFLHMQREEKRYKRNSLSSENSCW